MSPLKLAVPLVSKFWAWHAETASMTPLKKRIVLNMGGSLLSLRPVHD